MHLVLPLLTACSDPYAGADKSPAVGALDSAAFDSGETDSGDSSPDSDDTFGQETGIPDSDGDGYQDDVDCVADDETVYPGAPDTWYDGVDSDCAGNSDYDQDFDGFLAAEIGGDDCNDVDAATHPGATDTAYDGVDADCLGDDDFDQDLDGERHSSGGGEDCDDLNPDISPQALETLDDAIDSDCNGDVNSFRFTTLDTAGATGLQGPRIDADSSYLMVAFIADSYVDDSTATTYENGGIQHFFDGRAPELGSTGLGSWYWGPGYTMQGGFDFVVSDDYQSWAYGIQDGDTRYLLVDVYENASGNFSGTGWGISTTMEFEDVELTEAWDGTLHVVGCDRNLGMLTWMHGSPAEFFANSPTIAGDDNAATATDACVADAENTEVLSADRTRSVVEVFGVTKAAGLVLESEIIGHAAHDLDVFKQGTQEGWLAAEGADGTYVNLNGAWTQLVAGSATQAQADVSPLGEVYVGYTDRLTGAYLAWGEVAAGMSEMLLETGFPFVESIDVALTDTSLLLVVVRTENSAKWGVVAVK